jgi:predicted DCC family thiol-disulfide oxidoreductase YuxK
MPMSSPSDLVFFDGDCLFCQRRVRWLLERDRDGAFRFGPLQGDTARAVLAGTGLAESVSTLVLVHEPGSTRQEIRTKSRAIAAISSRLPFPWRLGGLLALVPRVIGDAVYDWIAARRHHWGGAAECSLFSTAERSRFVA